MTTLLADAITYGFPTGAIFLLATPVLIWLYWQLMKYREEVVKEFLGEPLNSSLSLTRSQSNSFWRIALLALSWMFATITLMQPMWQKVEVPTNPATPFISSGRPGDQPTAEEIQRKPHDVIFALDVSASMAVPDAQTGQTRLGLAKDVIADTVMRLPAENIGLYLFTSDVKNAVPATLDHLYLRMELQKVYINEVGLAGTDFRKVLAAFHKVLWPTPSNKLVTLVIVSDGGDTSLAALPFDQHEGYIKVILQQLGNSLADHRRIFTIGVGSLAGGTVPNIEFRGGPIHSALQVDLLQQLAQENNGVYLQASDFEGLGLSEELSSKIMEGGASPPQLSKGQTVATVSRMIPAPFPLHLFTLILAIAFLMLALVIPETDERSVVPMGARSLS